jgi:hypothetical protein
MSVESVGAAIRTAIEFRAQLVVQMARASKQGRPHIEVNAGEFHRQMGGYPPTRENPQTNQMPMLCDVMQREMTRGKAEVIHATTSGQAPALTIRYYLPRPR